MVDKALEILFNSPENTHMSSRLISNYCEGWKFVDFHNEAGATIIYSLLFAISIYWAILGYKYSRMTYLTITYTLTTCVTYFIISNYSSLAPWALVSITIGAPIIASLLSLLLKKFALFVVGMYSGCAIALCIVLLVGVLTSGIKAYFLYIPFGLLAIIGGFANVCQPIYCCIFSICNISGVCIFSCLDFFLLNKMITTFTAELLGETLDLAYPCWYAWLFIISWIVTIIGGCITQYLLTAKEEIDINYILSDKYTNAFIVL
ncbi:hypothetical protein MXB_2623 [Myxobolus squamalis]|nr:hypothetical protein MXB_2623 [Myxobolus squamalis]